MWNGIERRSCLKVNGNLSRLRELTMSLSQTVKSVHGDVSELKADGGEVKIKKLFVSKDLGIVTFEASRGSVHIRHSHPMNEWVGISRGLLIVHYDDGRQFVVKQHEVVNLPPNVPHRMEYAEESEGWAITMPKDEGF